MAEDAPSPRPVPLPDGTAPDGIPTVRAALRHWFRRPPRLHGEVDAERTVSFLELFYDLVFVVLVAQMAHTLADHPTWGGVLDFAVVFTLIWMAWLNGSLHHEGHGREDGRGRANIFGQMMILVVLAVFTAHATTEDGVPFAATYTVLLGWLAWQWNQVRRHDVVTLYRQISGRYIAMLVVSAGLMLLSIAVDGRTRFALWTLVAVLNTVLPMLQIRGSQDRPLGLMPTESAAERFGLLTIIVLGEVVAGVVGGVNASERSALVIVTALLALGVGFGFWWSYFDLLGGRPPRPTYRDFMPWILLHLPLAGVIAAAGAGMVGLIDHATDARTPAGPGWLLAGSSAALLVLVALLMTRVTYADHKAAVLPLARRALLLGAGASLVVGLLLPAPWLFALLLAAVHQAVWWSLFVGLARRTGLVSGTFG